MNKKIVLSLVIVLFLSVLVLVGAGCGGSADKSLYKEYCRLHKSYMEEVGSEFEADSINDCVNKLVESIEEGRKECLKEESREVCDERIEMVNSMFQGMIDEYKNQGLK